MLAYGSFRTIRKIEMDLFMASSIHIDDQICEGPNSKMLTEENCKVVDLDEYCRLAISSRRFVRIEEPNSPIRGLWDIESGEKFIIDAKQLD